MMMQMPAYLSYSPNMMAPMYGMPPRPMAPMPTGPSVGMLPMGPTIVLRSERIDKSQKRGEERKKGSSMLRPSHV